MRFQVPQYIDIQDKIVGPLTLKQFGIYFCTALVLIPVYLLSDLSLFLTIALPLGGLAAGFAHFKPLGKPLEVFLLNAFEFYTGGQLWTWRREVRKQTLVVSDRELEEVSSKLGRSDVISEISSLESASRSIETEGKIVNEDAEDPIAPDDTIKN